MMTGFLEPTSGTGMVEGCDIRTEMPAVYKMMVRPHVPCYSSMQLHVSPCSHMHLKQLTVMPVLHMRS